MPAREPGDVWSLVAAAVHDRPICTVTENIYRVSAGCVLAALRIPAPRPGLGLVPRLLPRVFTRGYGPTPRRGDPRHEETTVHHALGSN